MIEDFKMGATGGQEGRRAGGQEGRREGRRAGGQEGRRAGGHSGLRMHTRRTLQKSYFQ